MDISLLVRYLFVFCIFFRKKRLKNKDIAFYASLNSDSANDDGEKRNINSVRLFISTANWKTIVLRLMRNDGNAADSFCHLNRNRIWFKLLISLQSRGWWIWKMIFCESDKRRKEKVIFDKLALEVRHDAQATLKNKMNDCKLWRCIVPILAVLFYSSCIIADNLVADSSIPKKNINRL